MLEKRNCSIEEVCRYLRGSSYTNFEKIQCIVKDCPNFPVEAYLLFKPDSSYVNPMHICEEHLSILRKYLKSGAINA